jgi:hypothetical protein
MHERKEHNPCPCITHPSRSTSASPTYSATSTVLLLRWMLPGQLLLPSAVILLLPLLRPQQHQRPVRHLLRQQGLRYPCTNHHGPVLYIDCICLLLVPVLGGIRA